MNTIKCLNFLTGIILTLAAPSVLATQPTTYYIYDESGHVIGEYDASGNAIQEHVYLSDRPVAVVQGGGSGEVDYVTTDQLNTPRVITDSNQTVLWSWNSDPFGNGQPTGSLTYDLRFPGQQYDSETGHNDNYYRDYDPVTGRYIESDPIGLGGGINTYGYVSQNPLKWEDPTGQFLGSAAMWQAASEAELETEEEDGGPGNPFADAAALVAGAAAAYAEYKAEQCDKGDKCKKIIQDIYNTMNQLQQKIDNLLNDPLNLFELAYDSPNSELETETTYLGHIVNAESLQQRLRNLISEAKANQCQIPGGAWALATRPLPSAPRGR